LRRRSLLLPLLPLLTAIALTGAVSVAGAPAVQAGSSDAAYLVERINAVRDERGLAPLQVRNDLSRHARQHSGSMSRRRTLFHTASFRVVCCWSSIAENVAAAGTARGVHRALMGSAPHRANILDPDLRGIGIGVERDGGKLWVTQVFRAPGR